MFDRVLLYAIGGGAFALALAVAVFILFLRRYYLRRRSTTSDDGLVTTSSNSKKASIAADFEKSSCCVTIDGATDVKNAAAADHSLYAAHSRDRLLTNYGAAASSPPLPLPPAAAHRTLSMDSIISKPGMKTIQPTAAVGSPSVVLPRSTAVVAATLRQTSFPSPARPYENVLCEKVPEDESVDEYDYDQVPNNKYDHHHHHQHNTASAERKNSRVGPGGPLNSMLRRQSSSSTEASIGTIKPDLYLRKGSLFFQTGEGGASGCIGKVHLRFRYDFRRSDFIVTVIQAELPAPIHDCYLRMFLTPEDSDSATGHSSSSGGGGCGGSNSSSSGSGSNGGGGGSNTRYRQSKTRRRSTAFAFNEEFKFPIAFSELVEKTLVVQAFDCSTTTSRTHQQLGEVCLELRKADPSADIEVLADLTKIRVDENIFGSIEVALSYLPSVQRLTVSILQAKGLHTDDLAENSSGTIGIYVRCMLFLSGSKSATKKKKISAVPTSLPRRDIHDHHHHHHSSLLLSSSTPARVDVTWKEQVTFNLPDSACKSASLRLLVCAKHSRGGTEKILGQLNLGSEESARESRQHWRQMLKEKMESSVWHKLQMPVVENPAIVAAAAASSRLLECAGD